MKKLLLSIAALLPGLLAYSQEADDLGRYAEVTLIPRLDLNPTYTAGDSGLGFNHGNSSVYTLFEGSLSEHFSWTIANHWFQSGGDYAWPYRDLGRSDTTNWLDYFVGYFSFGNWTFGLGKDMIATGGFEYEDWDWDLHTDFSSPLAGGLACYQWGASVSWMTPSESTEFMLQMTTSPYGEHPFASGLWAYSFQWSGEYGWYSLIGSASALQYAKDGYDWLFAVGMNFDLTDELALTVDWNNSYGFDEDSWLLAPGHTIQGKLAYAPSDKFDMALRGWYAFADDRTLLPDCWTAGAVFQYYPLHDSDDLRLHACVAWNSALSTATLSIGARYNLRFKLF